MKPIDVMRYSATSSPTEFFQLVEETLGHRRYVKQLVVYYQTHLDKVKLWSKELDEAISLFNSSSSFPEYCINAIYLKKIIEGKLAQVNQIETGKEIIHDTLAAMNNFEFFDKEWQLDKLAAACVVAFYRTYVLTKFSYLKERKAQVASAIEETLAMMALKGKNTELFQATRHWIIDWQEQGFSKELANIIISSNL